MQDENSDRILESLCQINVNLEGLRVSLSMINELTTDHESRLRKIEVWKHNITPVLAVMTFVLGAVFTVALERAF